MRRSQKAIEHCKWHLIRVLRAIAIPVSKIMWGYQRNLEKGPGTPSIIISNHNTNFDGALVGVNFSRDIYFVASEHTFRYDLRSIFIKFAFALIPINRAQADAFAMREILHRLKAGYSVCIFAEGNHSFNGLTGHIPLSIAKLVRMSGADLITHRLEGGYFTKPRWARKKRRGKMAGRLMGRYSAAELRTMTHDQILKVIERDIHEDAYERQKEQPVRYSGKKRAEYIEIVLYLCPQCKKTGTIHSHGNNFSCSCGLNAAYTEMGFLEGENLPFSTITDWDKWQKEHLTQMVNNAGDEPICADDNQQLFLVQSAVGATFIAEGPMYINRTSFHCAGMAFPLQQIKRFTILGKMTLLFTLNDGTQYEIHSSFPRSPLKYLEIIRILKQKHGLFID
ncbi:MAG: 1-acyl-sn-glycerol-3-phosphate acyltransferase [Treponema sp.]|jgi:1-acyl-sn-glycerol-3-phosphate acyltransferase|nr:1-acyl-sn-glycerol-3-phosphate acyltransferase [Treponema sp.]